MKFKDHLEKDEIHRKFYCGDCNTNVTPKWLGIAEYHHMLKDNVWDKTGAGDNILCVRCIERRLGRKLTPFDFKPDVPINMKGFKRSSRLNDRMGFSETISRNQ